MDMNALQKIAERAGKTLTEPRKQVFTVLVKSKKPLSAYELNDLMPQGTKPMTTYRALDFLTGIGAAHRIESMNAYVICKEPHCTHKDSQYLICTSCDRVEELHNHAIESFVESELKKSGFKIQKTNMEVIGVCLECG